MVREHDSAPLLRCWRRTSAMVNTTLLVRALTRIADARLRLYVCVEGHEFAGWEMSSRPVQVQLPTGEVIWAKVTVDGPQNVASTGLQRLDVEELSRTVRGLSASLHQAVDSLMPDDVEIEFGIELALKSGMLISMLAEAGATASVKVTLGWKGDKMATSSAPEASSPAAEA